MQWCYIQQKHHGNDKTSLLTFSCLLVGYSLLPLRQLRVLDDGDPCNARTKLKQSLQHGDDCSVKMTECDTAHAMLQHNKRWLECEDDFDTAIAVRKRSVLPPSSRTKAALMIAVCAERFPLVASQATTLCNSIENHSTNNMYKGDNGQTH